MINPRLADTLATTVMGWKVSPDRYLTGNRGWVPKWRFQPTERLEDAFRLLKKAAPSDYSIGKNAKGAFWVRVRIGEAIGAACEGTEPAAITVAVARAVGIATEVNPVNSQDYPLLQADVTSIPEEIRSVAQWISWWSVIGGGRPVCLPGGQSTKDLKVQAKPHKLPINPRTGGLAATTREKTWSAFKEAADAAQRWSLSGVGFVFTDSDPYAGIDLDNCRHPETGTIAEWAWEIVRALDSYTEVSPSGTGLHTIVRGTLPKGLGNQVVVNGGKVEMFSRARYFTFTGIRVAGTPADIRERQPELTALHTKFFGQPSVDVGSSRDASATCITDAELIKRACGAKNAQKFRQLWDGNWQIAYPSQSEADLALCSHFAFWTNNDAGRIDGLFRQSGLMRAKWESDSYSARTIEAALKSGNDTYRPGRLGRNGHSRTGSEEKQAGSGQIPEKSCARDLLPYPNTDTGNAERLVRMYGEDIRFCFERKKWLLWDGRRWIYGDNRGVKRLFKKTIRETYKQAADIASRDIRETAEKHSRKSESATSIEAAIRCAESEDGMAVSANVFDNHPFLLNCLNGTLDLATGTLRTHNRKDFLSKLVKVNYDPGATCPRFLQFLNRIMSSDLGPDDDRSGRLVSYLQRCFGYALTSDVSEKAIFCFFGSGNNGKTTLLEAIRFVLTEYSAQVLVDTLMAHASRESNTSLADLADLHGARFVTTSEAEEGQRLAVGKLKYLTQGMGEIKVCRKYENPISFLATHKLFLDANHKPIVRGSERAAWNRLKAIPFTVQIPPEEIDRSLPQRLKEEAEGILAWLVRGCLHWQKEGLGEPPEVTEASAAWKAESDRFLAFFDELYTRQADGWVAVTEPWIAYTTWCNNNQERERLAKNAFDARLTEIGLAKRLRDGGRVRVWVGIRPKEIGDQALGSVDKVTGGDSKT